MSVEFKKGDRVIYVPNHANGDRNHPDCEHGVICRSDKVNENSYFVKYDNLATKMVTGDEPYTAALTMAEDLVLESLISVFCNRCDEKFQVQEISIIECPSCKNNIIPEALFEIKSIQIKKPDTVSGIVFNRDKNRNDTIWFDPIIDSGLIESKYTW